MKSLYLLRHGKSDWDADYGGADHDRPLAPRGEKAARRVGRFLAEADARPDRVIASTAVRARTTALLAHEAGRWGCPLLETPTLYEASAEAVLALVQAEPAATGRLLLVGHEPTWSTLTQRLIGGGSVRVPTAGLVRVDFEVEQWAAARFGSGTLRLLLPPKMLG